MGARRRNVLVYGTGALLLASALPLFGQNDPQGILNTYAGAQTNWQNAIAPYAFDLFKLLAAIDFAWTCITLALEKSDMQAVVAGIIKKLMTIGFFWILLAYAPQWFPLIIQSFVQVGGTASGQAVPLDPSQILAQGINIAKYLFNGASGSNLLFSPATSLALILAGLGIVLSYLVITIHFIMAMVESYIVIGAGYIFLGFGGSRWTSTYVERYVSVVVSVGARLMVLYLVIGVGQNFAAQWVAQAQIAAAGASADISTSWNLMCEVVIYGIVCWIVPKIAGSVIGERRGCYRDRGGGGHGGIQRGGFGLWNRSAAGCCWGCCGGRQCRRWRCWGCGSGKCCWWRCGGSCGNGGRGFGVWRCGRLTEWCGGYGRGW